MFSFWAVVAHARGGLDTSAPVGCGHEHFCIGGEIGLSGIRRSAHKPGENTLKAYQGRITLTTTYHKIIRLLDKIEASSPLLCVTDLSIFGKPKDNRINHEISFDVQWPVWADEETGKDLEEQLKEDELPAKEEETTSDEDDKE